MLIRRLFRIPVFSLPQSAQLAAYCRGHMISKRSVAVPGLPVRTSRQSSLPWRGEDECCFAMELVLDAIAREAGKSRIKCD